MAERILGPQGSKRRRRFLWVPLALVSVLVLLFVVSAQGSTNPPATAGYFELDKNAQNNITTKFVGTLGGNISSSATSFVVCQPLSPFVTPTTPLTIQIEAEQMTVTTIANASGGGCSGAVKKTYSGITRGVGTTAAAHNASGVAGFITQVISGAVTGDDWDQVNAAVSANGHPGTSLQNPCAGANWSGGGDAKACDWIADPNGTSVFTTGGSKDDLDINTTVGNVTTHNWMYTDQSVPDADDISDGGAIKYAGAAQGDHTYLFFGADRVAVNGSKDFGFWFFKSPVGLNADGTFSGQHTSGDILILGTFTGGGATASVRVFKWVGTGGDTNTVLQSEGTFGDCVPGPGGNGCNTVNDTTITSPWPYQSKISGSPANVIYSGGLMEGGLDLTALGLTGCFSNFLAETRSSPSIGAQLKDFLLGQFESCGATFTTTPSDNTADPNPQPLTDSGAGTSLPDVSIGTGSVMVTDTAHLNVTGTDNFTGTLKFFLCGPIASGTCDSGGVAKGSSTVTANGDYYSTAAKITSAGRYCWRGEFDSDTTGVPDKSDHSATECFEVLPVTPDLTTQAVDENGDPISGSVPFGSTIYDMATLDGTATQAGTNGPGDVNGDYKSIDATNAAAAGGGIVFTLYGPSDTACGDLAFTSSSFAVSGDDDYGPASYTPTLAQGPGTYHWKAVYTVASGDVNNIGSTHNANCDDTNEDVTLEQIPTSVKTKQSWVPNDTATITADTGNLAASGTVDFYLYDNSGCTGTALYHEQKTLTGGSSSEEVSTDNKTFTITTGYDDDADSTAGPYSWKVVYAPAAADKSHTGSESSCDAEHFDVTYTNDPGPTP